MRRVVSWTLFIASFALRAEASFSVSVTSISPKPPASIFSHAAQSQLGMA